MWRSIGERWQKISSNLYKLHKRRIFLNDYCWEVYFLIVRPHEFNQSNLRFLVKNTLLNNSHLERFNTLCTLFPMERHISRISIFWFSCFRRIFYHKLFIFQLMIWIGKFLASLCMITLPEKIIMYFFL